MARFAAVVCVYDDDSWLAPAIESVYAACEVIWFLVERHAVEWRAHRSDRTRRADSRAAGSRRQDSRGTRTMAGRSHERNEGLRLVAEAGIEYCFVLDADEIYDSAQLSAAMDIVRRHPQIDCWRLSCLTYWKSCRYRVEPPEALAAPVFIRVGSGRFIENRNFEAARQMRFAPETIVFHHMSYARTDEQILRKIKTWGHARDVVPDWYENVWRKWDDDHSLQNLNPCWPVRLSHDRRAAARGAAAGGPAPLGIRPQSVAASAALKYSTAGRACIDLEALAAPCGRVRPAHQSAPAPVPPTTHSPQTRLRPPARGLPADRHCVPRGRHSGSPAGRTAAPSPAPWPRSSAR